MKDRSCGCQVAEPPPALLMFACGASSRPKMSPRSLLGAESVENDTSCWFVSLPARACRFAGYLMVRMPCSCGCHGGRTAACRAHVRVWCVQ